MGQNGAHGTAGRTIIFDRINRMKQDRPIQAYLRSLNQKPQNSECCDAARSESETTAFVAGKFEATKDKTVWCIDQTQIRLTSSSPIEHHNELASFKKANEASRLPCFIEP